MKKNINLDFKYIYKQKTSNGSRHRKTLKALTTLPFKIKSLVTFWKKSNGRCNINGNITVRHRGNGVKNLYKKVSFIQSKMSQKWVILKSCYDPYRNANLSLVYDTISENFNYLIGTQGTNIGNIITNNDDIDNFNLGSRSLIKNLPIGSIVHSLTTNNTLKKIQYIRSAGTYGTILKSNNNIAIIKLPSKAIIQINSNNYATLGKVSNPGYNTQIWGKAGINRLLGRRPHVRGIAMNPVDHPHGGRSNGGKPSVTPWGFPTKCHYKLYRKKNKK